jgi:hypothetical protein
MIVLIGQPKHVDFLSHSTCKASSRYFTSPPSRKNPKIGLPLMPLMLLWFPFVTISPAYRAPRHRGRTVIVSPA